MSPTAELFACFSLSLPPSLLLNFWSLETVLLSVGSVCSTLSLVATVSLTKSAPSVCDPLFKVLVLTTVSLLIVLLSQVFSPLSSMLVSFGVRFSSFCVSRFSITSATTWLEFITEGIVNINILKSITNLFFIFSAAFLSYIYHILNLLMKIIFAQHLFVINKFISNKKTLDYFAFFKSWWYDSTQKKRSLSTILVYQCTEIVLEKRGGLCDT